MLTQFKKIKFHGYLTENNLHELVKKSDYILCSFAHFIYDYGFIDEYFHTKGTGSIFFGKPILFLKSDIDENCNSSSA